MKQEKGTIAFPNQIIYKAILAVFLLFSLLGIKNYKNKVSHKPVETEGQSQIIVGTPEGQEIDVGLNSGSQELTIDSIDDKLGAADSEQVISSENEDRTGLNDPLSHEKFVFFGYSIESQISIPKPFLGTNLEYFNDSFYSHAKKSSTVYKIDSSGEDSLSIQNEILKQGGYISLAVNRLTSQIWALRSGSYIDIFTPKMMKIKTLKIPNMPIQATRITFAAHQLLLVGKTSNIYIFDQELGNLKLDRVVEVKYKGVSVEGVMDIAIIQHKIWAIFQKLNKVIIINGNNGEVEKVIKLKVLVKHLKMKEPINSISYRGRTGEVFLTGKNWNVVVGLSFQ